MTDEHEAPDTPQKTANDIRNSASEAETAPGSGQSSRPLRRVRPPSGVDGALASARADRVGVDTGPADVTRAIPAVSDDDGAPPKRAVWPLIVVAAVLVIGVGLAGFYYSQRGGDAPPAPDPAAAATGVAVTSEEGAAEPERPADETVATVDDQPAEEPAVADSPRTERAAVPIEFVKEPARQVSAEQPESAATKPESPAAKPEALAEKPESPAESAAAPTEGTSDSAATREVDLATVPSRASVYDGNGTLLGKTPLALEVGSSGRVIKLARAGYERRRVTLPAAGPDRVEVRPKKKKGAAGTRKAPTKKPDMGVW